MSVHPLRAFRGYTPRYRLRAAFAYFILGDWPSEGRFVEVGPGTGEFLRIWASHGLEGIAHEISNEVLPRLRSEASRYSGIQVVEDPKLIATNDFDYLFAFEVLEHIDDDLSALRRWVTWLRPGGRVLISVPARMRHWTESDDLVGHYRRYEKVELRDLLRAAGLESIEIRSYGFPVTAITRRFRSRFARAAQEHCDTQERRTLHSALASVTPDSRTVNLAIDGLVAIGGRMQRMFAHSDLGDGYIASARKGS